MREHAMTRELSFIVFGVAVPKGSTRAFVIKPKTGGPMRAVTTAANPKTRGWQDLIAHAASQELQRRQQDGTTLIFDGSVSLELIFYLPRPLALLTKSKAAKAIAHVRKPDLDKLVRCADALTGVLWRDDAQVTDLIARKRYVSEGEFPRAEITVRDGPFPAESADRRTPALFQEAIS